ncbi:MAG TPA: pyridoxal-phosphate dependent enzyme [Bacteroidia bacterium]|jgi:1-aminocyclopropane-1-carboxylate deaminase/D-cysteine desulfhydrase-like pyridoxal-dependent ACC family enzyme
MQEHSSHIPLQRITDGITGKSGVELHVLRADLNHPHISGNKMFKLKYNLEEAGRQQKSTILTFGGAFSNHIAAVAAAGKEHGLKTIGIIRGEQVSVLNPTLRFAKEQGMELHFVSREIYRLKDDIDFFTKSLFSYPLNLQLSDCYIIPEGGANVLGIKGCMEIRDHIHVPFEVICCACGTGTTFTGIVLSLQGKEKALGFQVLKGKQYIHHEVNNWLDKFQNSIGIWDINEDYHFGGYAKYNESLLAFMAWFKKEHGIELDFVYTGKMMFGLYDLLEKGYFREGERIIAVHTGGLQGNGGLLW